MRLLISTVCLGFLAGCIAQECTPGDKVDSIDPCEKCMCVEPGNVVCETVICPPCGGEWVSRSGQCCSTCVLPELGCVVNGAIYQFGADIPTDDPCEICTCFKVAGVLCAMISCEQCLPPNVHIPVSGTCCGVCHRCSLKGRSYQVGRFVHPDDKCQSCRCHLNGTVTCEQIFCPAFVPPCKAKLWTTDRCCPVCKCRHRGKIYNPGPVGKKCKGCVCNNGKVTCTKPTCPKLMCVDSVPGKDCCRECPQGVTCMAPKKTIIKAGEKRIVQKQECFCDLKPWFANAYCANLKISKKLKKANGNLLANVP